MVTMGRATKALLKKRPEPARQAFEPQREWAGVALGIEAAALIAGVVALLCGAIAVASWRAVVRTGNRRIQLVVAAFAILAAKNLVKSLRLAAHQPDSPALELVFSLVDLLAVALIAWPLFVARRA
ncbi:MAG: hypothetical protein QOC71_1849 [Thermoplasmata archaeon]|jgi:hypothetical protein|nr:hypothetical protein [Thermoplasmata archaeon]